MRAAAILTFVLLLAALSGCPEQECMAHCPDDRQLVCGTDDVTYDNSCHAACVGEDVQYAGPCTGSEDTVDQD